MMGFEDVLLPDPEPSGPEFWRATVIDLNPLRVERTQGIMPATPENFAGPLRVGDRVFGITINTRPVILGRAGGGGVPFAVAAGTVDVAAPSGGGIGTEWVDFPAGRFTQPPIVTVSGNSSATIFRSVRWSGVTAEGFNAHLHRDNDTVTTVSWQAMQMTPTSAEG